MKYTITALNTILHVWQINNRRSTFAANRDFQKRVLTVVWRTKNNLKQRPQAPKGDAKIDMQDCIYFEVNGLVYVNLHPAIYPDLSGGAWGSVCFMSDPGYNDFISTLI